MFYYLDSRFVENWTRQIMWLNNIVTFPAMLGRKLREQRKNTAKRTDERIRLMNEIISGIKVIKLYTWEIPFEKLIEYIRKYLTIL